jgi:hypothetical protein
MVPEHAEAAMRNHVMHRWLLGGVVVLLLGSAAPAAAQNILVIQNNNPWGEVYWPNTLASLGYSYSQLGASSIPTVTLSNYDLVIVPSQQPSSFNTSMNSYMWKFEDYVSNGGGLILMLATYFSETPITTLPYGATATHGSGYESANAYNVNPSHPIMAGLPASMNSNYASHGRLNNYGTADVLTTDDYNQVSSYVVLSGSGGAYVSELTLEWAGSYDFAPVGANAIEYLLNGVCQDGDGDGYQDLACGGDDCDDLVYAVNPGAIEVCNGYDDNCDGVLDDVDADGDGYYALACNGDDCNDGDAYVNPGAIEIPYNGFDENCDGVDEADLDGDGYDAWFAGGDDCDDNDGAVNPVGTESCNGIDDDCDGTVDEGTECYDDDGDGITEQGGDCNDGSVGIHPGAFEICDGIDQDCDGTVDEDTECYDDDGDGLTELDGDCNDANGAVYPGAVEICDGVDNDCNLATPPDEGTDCFDDDGDGYAEAGGDCDDADPNTYPNAPE